MASGDGGAVTPGYVSVASLEVKEHGIYSRNIEFNSSKLSGN
jgi:hypothetical protein